MEQKEKSTYEDMERARIQSLGLSKFARTDFEKTLLDAVDKANLDLDQNGASPPVSDSKYDEKQRQKSMAEAEVRRHQIIVEDEMVLGETCPQDEKAEHSRRLLKKELNLKRAEHSKHRLQA